jgi:hypothetical protein
MFLLNGNPLPIDTQFEVNGTTYPQNWLRLTSIEEKNAIGITEVADPEPYDDRFYWGVDNPKDLDGLKTLWTEQVKDTANKLLSQTDWMVIRKVERSVDVPADTTTYRQGVIAECTRLVEAISGCTDVPSLITVVTTQNWGE